MSMFFLDRGPGGPPRWLAALTLAALVLGPAPAARAQDAAPAGPRAALDRYHRQDPYEKLFLHLDRSAYVSGDILWFKVYAVEGTGHRPLPLSTVAYVEVLDGAQKPVLQAKIGLKAATGHGSFQLPATLPTGRYTVRAYTSLMKNFGPESYFQSPITVVSTFAAPARGAADSVVAAAYDVQFFPEGGHLVNGLKSRVGVKVVDRAGRGVAAEGVWLDRQGQVAARFQTLKYGMGRFELLPSSAGAPYTAVTRLPGQQTLTRQAPAVREQGYGLRLESGPAGQLLLTVSSTAGAEEVQLLGHARQRVFVSKSSGLSNGQAQFVLERADLPEGVLHFTVFNGRQQPVCERLYFRRPAAGLQLRPLLSNSRYRQREKVGLTLHAATAQNQPAAANVSVAVYRLDKLAAAAPAADISSTLWLTSEVKGWVEDPGYYLAAADGDAEEAADNLMLTQGWRRFSWDKVLAGPAPLRHLPELNGPFVEGQVVSKAGAPLPGVAAFLAVPSRHVRLYNALSRADGGVRFELREASGPRQLVVQADARQDSSARVELFSPFSAEYAARPLAPLPALDEQYRPELTQRHVEVQSQTAFFARPLSPFARPLTDSSAFYGKPAETYRLDDYTRFTVLEEVLREYVPGVQVRQKKQEYLFLVEDKANKRMFNENPMVLVDGVPVFNMNNVLKLDPLKVQRLDVMTNLYIHGPLTYSGLVSFTTYRGDLGGVKLAPGARVEDYEGLQWEREFYSPRYETPEQQQSRLLDLRNLLYWNPEVSVSAAANGQKLEFFTPDQPGQYQVVVQGLNGSGLAGSASATFEVQAESLARSK